MGIYIDIDMKMTEDGLKNIMILADGRVFQFSGYGNPKPLGTAVSVPPHGRLIDADVFTYKIKEEVNKCTATGCKADRYLIPGYIATMKFVNDLPTLISASEEGSV